MSGDSYKHRELDVILAKTPFQIEVINLMNIIEKRKCLEVSWDIFFTCDLLIF
jgi:hypothetical protein